MIDKFTTNKNNHYIQAAWAGQFWGYTKHTNKSKKGNRHNKVWVLNIGEIFKDKNIDSWPSVEILQNDNKITNKSSAEKFFLSGYVVLDDIDIDFANNCEGFLSAIETIETKIINNYQNDKESGHSIFNLHEKKELIEQLKSYICLHLSRTKLSAVKSFQRVDNKIEQNDGLPIPLYGVSEEELENFNTDYIPVTESSFYKLKKIIAYYDMRDNFNNFSKKIKNYNNIQFIFNVCKSDGLIKGSNFLTEIPFISGESFSPEGKKIKKEEFLNVLKENKDFNNLIFREYGNNYHENKVFLEDINKIFDNFIVGVLTPHIKLFLSEDLTTLSDIFKKWLINDNYCIYEELSIQNNFNSLICNSLDNLILSYEYLTKVNFNEMKKNYQMIDKVLSNSISLTELMKKHLQYNYFNYQYIIKYKFLVSKISLNSKN